MGYHLTREQSQVIKQAISVNNLKQACEILKISHKKAVIHCQSKAYRIKPEFIPKRKPYNMQMQANLIEDFLTGNYTLNELGLKYNTYATRISYIISKYFPYKGFDGVCITLGSKV